MLCYVMLYYTMLCYAMLCYAMLYYAMLCYAVLYCTMLCYAILYYTLLYSTPLYSTILYYTILYLTYSTTLLYYTTRSLSWGSRLADGPEGPLRRRHDAADGPMAFREDELLGYVRGGPQACRPRPPNNPPVNYLSVFELVFRPLFCSCQMLLEQGGVALSLYSPVNYELQPIAP